MARKNSTILTSSCGEFWNYSLVNSYFRLAQTIYFCRPDLDTKVEHVSDPIYLNTTFDYVQGMFSFFSVSVSFCFLCCLLTICAGSVIPNVGELMLASFSYVKLSLSAGTW